MRGAICTTRQRYLYTKIMNQANILIVEDEPIVAMDIQSSLESLGYQVADAVATGELALECIEKHNPDLVLMDISLKGSLDGMQTARLIQQRSRLPIVFLTAFLDEKILKRAIATEPFGYILKPFQVHDLLTAIEIALYKFRIEQQLIQSNELLESRVSERTKELEQTVLRLQTEIAERKEAEAKLAHTSQFNKLIADHATNFIFVKDIKGRFLFINKAMAAAFGSSPEEMIQTHNDKVLANPGKYEIYFQQDRQVLEAMSPVAFDDVHKLQDGRVLNFQTIKSPLRFGEKTVHILGISTDITERKNAERALRESEERLKSTLFSIDDLVLVISNDQMIAEVHQAASKYHFVLRSQGVIGKPFEEALPPSFAKPLRSAINQVFATKKVQHFNCRLEHSGKKKWFSTKVSIRKNSAGQFEGVTAVVRDVTERKEKEETAKKLKQKSIRAAASVQIQENERRRFARELHDGLGQILTAAKLKTEVLRDSCSAGNQKAKEALGEIEGLLNSAIVEGKRISYNLMPSLLDDYGIIPALEKLCWQTSESSSIPMKFYTNNRAIRLRQDVEIGIYRIVQESLNNIVKHAEAQKVTIQLISHTAKINLIIEDDGLGFQVERNGHMNGKKHGGMGLINIRERTEGLSGTFSIHSKPGRGTEIIVELPIKENVSEPENQDFAGG